MMWRPWKTIDSADTGMKLDELQMAVRREMEGSEADPSEDAMVAAVVGLAGAMKAEADVLAGVEAQMGKLARRATRPD